MNASSRKFYLIPNGLYQIRSNRMYKARHKLVFYLLCRIPNAHIMYGYLPSKKGSHTK